MGKMVRKQVFITAEQNKKLKAHAAASGVSENRSCAPASACSSSASRRRQISAAWATASRVRGRNATIWMRKCW